MPHFLQAGPMQVRYENGFLRYMTIGDSEILRMIYVAIRDRNWQTTTLVILNETIEQSPDSFRVNYDWETNDLGIQMTGHVAIQGNTDGVITVDFYGKAVNDFQKNRIGLCVLHPAHDVLGQSAEVTSPDGSLLMGHFPTFISPNQPFLAMKTFRWQSASGSVWQLDFSGDVFEMEDQRNWTDASFKTYSTPVALPFPVAVSVGDEFRQQVIFGQTKQSFSGEPSEPESRKWAAALDSAKPTRPQFGVGQRTGGPALTATEANLLKPLNLSHLRTDVFFSLPDWSRLLSDAIADAELLEVPLELAVFFGEEPLTELHLLQTVLREQNAEVGSILLFEAATLTTSDELLKTVVPELRTEWAGLAIGGGTDDHFAGLNRNHFNTDWVDFVTYSVCPQAHATDELTITENIAGLLPTVLTARQFGGGKPIHISPVAFKPRNITVANVADERQTNVADPRQATEFGAEWTRQSLTALADAGVASITCYQSHGPGGLVNGDTVYPVYDAVGSLQ
ncbi:hypothetical protein [Spirosoma endbachense]|uniref:Uncharacterized protein n=1 Tax=Spirosoma endbachense TaxID=2666025 RepID=A0A6P1W5A4_9BACT|nr:hypothetical protein [Spirosoma endbachense]QHW00206.1 hypothetical protein GJR95_36595 [Spirosoma endbachense]